MKSLAVSAPWTKDARQVRRSLNLATVGFLTDLATGNAFLDSALPPNRPADDAKLPSQIIDLGLVLSETNGERIHLVPPDHV